MDDEWLVMLGGYVGFGPRAVVFNDFYQAKAWGAERRKLFGCSADVVSMKAMNEVMVERQKSLNGRGL